MPSSRLLVTTPVAVSLLSALLLVGGCGKPPGGAPAVSTAPPQVGVMVVEPQRVAITTELPGRTSPYLVAEVRPQVGGLVKTRNFREGSDVKAGAVLYQIDSAPYRAAYGNAEALLRKAEASLESVRLRADRYAELVTIEAVSRQDHDDARAALRQGEADVAAAKAALETERINLAYTQVTAPIAGRVGRSSVTAGALVTASQTTPLATVQQLDPIYVDVTQSSQAMLQLKRALASGRLTKSGDNAAKVALLMEDGTAYALAGRLQFSDVTVDQNTGAITLRAVFPNPKGELLPGMYVRAVLEEGIDEKALLVPQPAVSRDAAGRPNVMVVGADNKLQLRAVKTERAIGDQWLVSEGIAAGERLAVDGAQKARPGMAVQAVPYARAASQPAAKPAVAQAADTVVRN